MILSSFLHTDGFKYCYLTSVICLHTFCSIWLIEHLSGAIGQSEPESNGNEGVFCIPQCSKAGTSPLDGLMSYPRHP